MKWLVGFVVVGAVVAWWWSRRQRQGVGYQVLYPPLPPQGSYANPADLAAGAASGPGWKDKTAAAIGFGWQTGAQGYCVSQGGNAQGCQIAGQVAGTAGKYATKGAIAVGGGVVKGTKAVASVAKKGLKAIVPFW